MIKKLNVVNTTLDLHLILLFWNKYAQICQLGYICLERTFLVENAKIEQHHLILHIRISLKSITKYMRLTLVFMRISTLREKVYVLFFKSFLLVLMKFTFWQKDWALDYYSIRF